MKTSPATFLRQVKQEISKITWPTRRETVQATIVVMVMCVFLALCFCFFDWASMRIVKVILDIGA